MTPEAHFLVNAAQFAMLLAALIGVTIFAWMKGEAAEKFGAAIYACSSFASFGLGAVLKQALMPTPEFFLDALVAFGFLVLAIRYNSMWLGAAMLLKGLQLALHAIHLTDTDDPHVAGLNVYGLGLNFLSLMMMACIFGGTLASMQIRRRSRTAPAPIAAQAA
jgi:hypothetical protein